MALQRLFSCIAGSHSGAGISPRIAQWRGAVVDYVALYLFVAALGGYLIALHSGWPGHGGYGAVQAALVIGLLATAAFGKRFGVQVRTWMLFSGLALGTLMHVHYHAFLLPNGYVSMSTALVLGTVLCGRRAAWSMLLILVIALCGYAAAFVSGRLPVAEYGLDASQTSNWLRVLLAFTAVAGIGIAAVGFLVGRLEQAVLEGDRLVRAVADQSEQRISALEAQNQLAARLRRSQKMEAVGRLAGGVAHDFNNLLVVILNNAELYQDRATDPELREALGHIVEASQRAAGLTRQLLAFGRRQVNEREALDVNRTIDESLKLIRPLLPESITVQLELADDAGYAWAAMADVDQITMNLCVNARDAMPGGGKLRIRTRATTRPGPDGDPCPYVCVVVEDSGCGMTEQECERVFEPFYTTKETSQGTGLGLSVVHGMVAQSGGYIDVRSRPGEGTRFEVYLPSCPEPAALCPDPPHEAPHGHEMLMVVDDDEAARRVLCTQLRRVGYRVLEFDDGLAALAYYDQHISDVAMVITDVVMPRMGGRALCEALAERAPGLPLLLWSGHAAHMLSARFLEHPLRGFLAKPFGGRQLLVKVRALLDRAMRGDGPTVAAGGV